MSTETDKAVPPVVDGGWHPGAKRYAESNSGAFTGGGKKLVWHTTEGVGFPDYPPGYAPHFTLNPATGELRQHIPITLAAAALEHPSGTPETNHANAIQVELIGYAATTQNWSDTYYRHIRRLARWIETHAGVPRSSHVEFAGEGKAHRMSGTGFVAYAGHCGHEHVPNNTHWDPGDFAIGKVLGKKL